MSVVLTLTLTPSLRPVDSCGPTSSLPPVDGGTWVQYFAKFADKNFFHWSQHVQMNSTERIWVSCKLEQSKDFHRVGIKKQLRTKGNTTEENVNNPRGTYADPLPGSRSTQTWPTMKSWTKLFQLYSCSWNAIVVVVVELEIFKSWETNICPFKHLETSCIEQKSQLLQCIICQKNTIAFKRIVLRFLLVQVRVTTRYKQLYSGASFFRAFENVSPDFVY